MSTVLCFLRIAHGAFEVWPNILGLEMLWVRVRTGLGNPGKPLKSPKLHGKYLNNYLRNNFLLFSVLKATNKECTDIAFCFRWYIIYDS